MKQSFLSFLFIPILLLSTCIPVFSAQGTEEDEWIGTPYEILQKQGISLEHYIVTFKSPVISKGYYKAVASNGKIIRFRETDVEIELFVGDRVRTYWEDGGFNIAEYVKPEKVSYKITRAWFAHGEMNFKATSKKYGNIQFTEQNIYGKNKKLLPGNNVIAEFDQMFIENGLIGIYKAK